MCDFLRAKRCLAWIFHYARSGAAGDCVRYNLFTKKIRHGLIFRIVDFSVYKFAFAAHNREKLEHVCLFTSFLVITALKLN